MGRLLLKASQLNPSRRNIRTPVGGPYYSIQALSDTLLDYAWSRPEDGGVIVQSWHPPKEFDMFHHGTSLPIEEIMDEWTSLKAKLGSDVASERYARLHAIQTSELEDVFLLGGDSRRNLVRGGFFVKAFDEIIKGPPGGAAAIINILEDLQSVSL